MSKRQIGIRVSDDAHEILKELSRRKGINQTATIETIIREAGKREGITPNSYGTAVNAPEKTAEGAKA